MGDARGVHVTDPEHATGAGNGTAAVPFRTDAAVRAALPVVVAHLRREGIVAHPTETVYGLGSVLTPVALQRLSAYKGRGPRPFLLLVDGLPRVDALGLRLSDAARRLAEGFWPGPLTLVLAGGAASLPQELRGEQGGIAVRWTAHRGMHELVTALDQPITSTSANPMGLAPAMDAAAVLGRWPREAARGELMVLDGGALAASLPSTVVDCTLTPPRVLRIGALDTAVLRDCVPDLRGEP